MKKSRKANPVVSSEEDEEEDQPEMDVEQEEKVNDNHDNDSDDEENDETPAVLPSSERSAFLDAFYGLASTDARERAVAGQAILHHAFVANGTNDDNIQDAAYALKRLLNGLCSGRAAARQGNASCLASFLKLAYANGMLQDIYQHTQNDDKNHTTTAQDNHLLAYVRQRLLKATALEEGVRIGGRKKASEIKDNNFGRLFGVLAVIRSGILQHDDRDQKSCARALLKDLHELYTFKPYMREPAAHAVCMLLNFYVRQATISAGSKNKKNKHKANHNQQQSLEDLVNQSAIPLFLEKGDHHNGQQQSAEQIAMGLNIQTQTSSMGFSLLAPLQEPLLTQETIVAMAPALAETCTVNLPRTHLVWDTLWLYLFQSTANNDNDNNTSSLPVDLRELKPDTSELLSLLVDKVIVEQLIVGGHNADESNDDKASNNNNKTTHERRALALTVLRTLAGVEYVSSLSGRTQLILDGEAMTSMVFQPTIVQQLFLNVVVGNNKSGKKGTAGEHMLKPLATQTLEQIVQASPAESKLAIAQALVCCDPRFDGRSRTSTVHDLLGMSTPNSEITEDILEMWTSFAKFLQDRILLAKEASDDEKPEVSTTEASALADLLLNLTKRIMKTSEAGADIGEEPETSKKYSETMVQSVLRFFMVVAFCDGTATATPQKNSKKKKMKGKQDGLSVQLAKRIDAEDRAVPFEVRTFLCSRFYSLLTEYASVSATSANGTMREAVMFQIMVNCLNECKELESAGFSVMAPEDLDEHDSDDDAKPSEIVDELALNAEKALSGIDGTPEPKERYIMAMGLLGAFLQLCQMSCYDPNDKDISEMADMEDIEEIRGLIEEAKECWDVTLTTRDDSEEVANPLNPLIALSINLISSSFGSSSDGSRGASGRLIREIVKAVMTCGMTYMAKESSSSTEVDAAISSILLQSVGVESSETEDDMDDEDDGDDEDESMSEGSNEEGLFSKPRDAAMLDDDEEEEEEIPSEDKMQDEADDKDEVIDNNRLNLMLEEDSDADIDRSELEHHEGADAALAKLIKMKQEARKAGQAALERVNLSQNLRCLMVLEHVSAGKPEGWGPLLRADVTMSMVPSLLRRCSQLERADGKVASRASDPAAGDRSALLNRLSAFLKTKLLKSKIHTMSWSNDVDATECCGLAASEVFGLAAQRISKDLRSMCYHALPTLLRAQPANASVAADLYGEAVEEWATKKSSRVEAKLFEELINMNAPMAQSVLVKPFVNATPRARSSFLKSECFRLVSSLYNPKINQATTDEEKTSLVQIMQARESFLEATITTFEDPEMIKAKRLKEVLRSVNNVIFFDSEHVTEGKTLSSNVKKKFQAALQSVAEKSDSDAAKSMCESLLSRIEADLGDSPNATTEATESVSQHTATKSGKKKKKKKKGKR